MYGYNGSSLTDDLDLILDTERLVKKFLPHMDTGLEGLHFSDQDHGGLEYEEMHRHQAVLLQLSKGFSAQQPHSKEAALQLTLAAYQSWVMGRLNKVFPGTCREYLLDQVGALLGSAACRACLYMLPAAYPTGQHLLQNLLRICWGHSWCCQC